MDAQKPQLSGFLWLLLNSTATRLAPGCRQRPAVFAPDLLGVDVDVPYAIRIPLSGKSELTYYYLNKSRPGKG